MLGIRKVKKKKVVLFDNEYRLSDKNQYIT